MIPPWVQTPPTPLPPGPYVITCYNKPAGSYPTYRIAKAALIRHIWSCPWGAMEWARPVQFHYVDHSDRNPPGKHGWVTAARGEWLSHRVDIG